MNRQYTSNSAQDTRDIAESLRTQLKVGDILCLIGDLGVGKTEFVRGLLLESQISSPTYNIVNIYNTSIGSVWHCDFYRLKTLEELDELGLDQAFTEAITIIEWPELAKNHIGKNYIEITISNVDNQPDDTRIIKIKKHGK